MWYSSEFDLFEMSHTYQEDLFSFWIKKKLHFLFGVPRAQRKPEKGERPLWKSLADTGTKNDFFFLVNCKSVISHLPLHVAFLYENASKFISIPRTTFKLNN